MTQNKPQDPRTPAPVNPLAGLAEPQKYIADQREIAPEIRDWVESNFKHWANTSKDWRKVVLPDEATAQKVIDDGRYYAKEIRDVPLTIQVRDALKDEVADGKRVGTALVYRVRSKVNAGRKPNGEGTTGA
jgi:hypothetical protein